jgi:HSP20 family protein
MNIVRFQRYPQRDLSVAFGRLTNMRNELDRVFGSSFGAFLQRDGVPSGRTPAVDVYQDKDQFTVYAELPGLKKEELEISLNGETLTIAGARKQEANPDEGFRTERSFGKFQRTLTLPVAVNAENVSATYKDGILKVVLPKAEEAKSKQIPVSLS